MDNLFSRIRATARDLAKNVARHTRAMLRLDKPELLSSSTIDPFKLDVMDPRHPWTLNPDAIKRLLPRSGFTKKGPGVSANRRAALIRMTSEQRAVCRAHGWI